MKAKARRLLEQARKEAELRALPHEIEIYRFGRPSGVWRERPGPQPTTDDEVKGGSPLENIPLPEYVPETWTVEWVATRMIKAWEFAGFGMTYGPSTRAFWPEYFHTLRDMNGWLEGDFRARPLEEWAKMGRRLSAHELALNGQAESWPLAYLRDHETEAKALMLWLTSKVRRGMRLNRALSYRKIPLSTHKRHRATALRLIADGLNRDGVPVE